MRKRQDRSPVGFQFRFQHPLGCLETRNYGTAVSVSVPEPEPELLLTQDRQSEWRLSRSRFRLGLFNRVPPALFLADLT